MRAAAERTASLIARLMRSRLRGFVSPVSRPVPAKKGVSKENKVCQPAANRIAERRKWWSTHRLPIPSAAAAPFFPRMKDNKKRKFRDPWNPTAAAHVDCVGRTQPVANFRQTHWMFDRAYPPRREGRITVLLFVYPRSIETTHTHNRRQLCIVTRSCWTNIHPRNGHKDNDKRALSWLTESLSIVSAGISPTPSSRSIQRECHREIQWSWWGGKEKILGKVN